MGEFRIADISEHNGYISFSASDLARYDGFIIRAGYGVSTVDSQFKRNIEGLQAAGKKVGVYWFGYAGTEEQAKVEARKCYETIKQYDLDLPVFYDWEYDSENYNNRMGIYFDRNTITKICVAFLEEMRKFGYDNLGVYYNLDYQIRKVNVDTFRQYKYILWYAQYSNYRSDTAGEIDIWQYSSNEYYLRNIYGGAIQTDANVVLNDRIFGENKTEQKQEQKEEEKEAFTYCVRNIYETNVDGLRVRKGAGLNAEIKNKSELTPDGRNHSYDNGTLKKGTKVTCLEIKIVDEENVWMRVPSGWICAVFNGEIYVK